MTMYDLCKKVDCKYITWSNGGGDSCTAWLECKLHKEITDEKNCASCKDRASKTREECMKRLKKRFGV